MKQLQHSVMALVCLFLSVVFTPVICHAQDFAGRWAIQPVVGMGLPVGDFGENLDPGPVFGGKLRVNPHKYYSIDLTFLHGPKYGLSNEVFNDPNIDARTKITQITIDNNVYIHTPGKVKPFFRFGLGLYRVGAEFDVSFQGETISTSMSENHFGINLGPGLEIKKPMSTNSVRRIRHLLCSQYYDPRRSLASHDPPTGYGVQRPWLRD